MKLLFLTTLILGLVGCASSSHKTRPLKFSLSSVKEVSKKSIPAKLKTMSPNGREMFFDYFPLPSAYAKRPGYTKDGKFLERARAKVVVLGERRPYTVEVTIPVETLQTDGTYSFLRNDLIFAKFITEKIETSLAKRQEGRDLIDDFRAF